MWLRIISMKGLTRFKKKGKLSVRFIYLFEILRSIREMDHELDLPTSLLVIHPKFHVSMLHHNILDEIHVNFLT